MSQIAIYLRVSSNRQDTRSQEQDLTAWAASRTEPVKWYMDKRTGINFNRPGWQDLYADILAGKVSRVVVWRLDRLGRTAGPLITLLDELEAKKISFLSLRDGFDPSTPAGRLTRNVLASVAQFETEVRAERQRAGIDAVQEMIAKGEPRKTRSGRIVSSWSPREAGNPRKLTPETVKAVKRLKGEGQSIASIARVLGLSRPTVYIALRS